MVLTHQVEAALKAHEYAKTVLERVRALMVHYPRATASGRYLTLSAGACTLAPPRDMELSVCVAACMRALQRAKGRGKNTVLTPDAADFNVATERGTRTCSMAKSRLRRFLRGGTVLHGRPQASALRA